ncbi:unnamed protein product [Adineta steineri]|uniref:Fibronectin type-III domain-containing protein n=1 Tax=Adineta steineri TaxID=433720 RepID=A0A818P3K6_9BILA|nr:unnamed protein product [Adineta steineri]
MASLQNNELNNHLQSDDDDADVIHIIDIRNGTFPEHISGRIESNDTIEFKVNSDDDYDIFQVYKDNTDYYRIDNGIELFNINNNTSEKKRRIVLSFSFHCTTMELYFCIIPSLQHETYFKSRQCPKENCEKNYLVIYRNEMKFSFNDNKESQKIILHKNDTIELEWISKRGNSYRIEENRYCPISGGLYKIEQPSDIITNHAVSQGKFQKTFNEYGTSFLFRLTETNQIHDIMVCIIKDKYQIKHIEITDINIQPNIISIEQNDSIIFEWNTKEKQTLIQIDPYLIDKNTQQSIELKTIGEHFFWPYEPSYRGYMIHKFNQTGIFCFKTANNQIGTIIVEPKKNIYSFPIFGDQLILKMNTNDFVQFEWKMTDSQEEPVLITVDANTSIVPDVAGGLTGIFDCSMHKCVKVEPFFRSYFHTCETFLLHIPQHGLYSFAYCDNRDDVVLSVIVENSINNHHITYSEQNMFEPNTIIVNRNDQVWFDSISANFYRTDEYGNHLDVDKPIFQPQLNSMNYFMQQFKQIGIYYFSTDIMNNNYREKFSSSSSPLAIIVLPEIHFHYKFIRLGDFDFQAIITNINDFVIWQFEQIIRFGVIQLRSNETLQDLASCHDRAVSGRNRQCLAVECIMPGIFYFANPEFERVTGSEQDRLISTIIIDPPFSEACFLITHQQFIPNVLHIAQNESISWVLLNNDQYHRIYVESNENEKPNLNENNRIDRSIEHYVPDIHYLYTFNQCGQYTVRSDRFNNTATVIVYSDDVIRNDKKRIQQPQIIEEIDTLSQFKTRVHLKYPNQDGLIYYTLDGTLPTRHHDNVHIYNTNEDICFDQPGFHILRAYATENEKISSSVITSSIYYNDIELEKLMLPFEHRVYFDYYFSPTFVMENDELEIVNESLSAWSSTKINLSASIQYPNKLYGKIQVEPTSSADLVDHFELYVDDIAQSVNLSPTDIIFSAEGFAGGEQYEIYILAYPKSNIINAIPIPSNKRAFEIKREIHGAPLISLAVSNEQTTIFLMWAHIGGHVSEYIVYVDDIERTTIFEKDFNDFFGIQFHGAQQRKRYLLHVEAKLKNSNDIRKSNILNVNPPLEMPLKEQLIDRYFAYITVNAEIPPPDMRLEIIHLDHFPHPRPEPQRKIETLSITPSLQDVIPTISFQQNSNGITLFWSKSSERISDIVHNYRIIVDGEQYGESISPSDEPNFQLNLSPGKHECYLSVIPKDDEQEIWKSNILQFDIPSIDDQELEQKPLQDSSNIDDHGVSDEKDDLTTLNVPLSQPILKVTQIGIQMVNLSWTLNDSVDPSWIKAYRIIVNTKPTEILPPNQHEYKLENLEPDTTNKVQISVTSRSDFADEKISEPVHIICPPRPQSPTIQSIDSNQPFSIGIKWKINKNNSDKITSFKLFLDGKLHDEIDTDGQHSFKYEYTQLQINQTYSIFIKACIKQNIFDGSIYQCDIESNASNELILQCITPSKIAPLRIERMRPDGIDIVWDTPTEDQDMNIIGYQILKNGQPIGKPIPVDQRRASIHDLVVGNRYSLQVVSIRQHSDSFLEYNPENHDSYLLGPKLDIEFTDLIQIPSKLWIENISGHSAVVCWSQVDDLSNENTIPDSFKLHIWNSREQTRHQTTVISISKDKTSQQLKDLQASTIYEVQLEAYKRRYQQITNESYIVSTISDILTFETGAPPNAPSNLHIISSTNTAVRLGFDPFIEHSAEIIALRVHCESFHSGKNSRDIIFDLTPDSIEFLLSNLIERTEYNVTVYAITDEYLNEIGCHDISQLPKKLKLSSWLISQSLQFTTSGCEPASQLHICSATFESIQLEWILPKAYGSTKYLSQILRWKLERGSEEHSMELDCNTTNAIIPGILQQGLYRISLDSLFSMKINLEDDEMNRKEICLTISEITLVRYRIPDLSERPEICLTGYTTSTIDLTWNKPNMFSIIDHPERLNEQIKIHRKLLGYRVEINGRKYNTLDENQYQCTLTECHAGEEYKVRLVAQTSVQNEYLNDMFLHDDEPNETPSKKLRVRMLTDQDLLRSFQANFEFHHHVTRDNIIEQRNEIKPLGKINIHWIVSNIENISYFILQWHSSKDSYIQQKLFKSNETSFTIDVCDEKEFYIIEIIIVTNDDIKYQYEQLKMPIPGEPDAPKLWLLKTSDSNFVVEWSEPKSYGIPIIGFQLYIEGKKAGDMVEVDLRRAEIPSEINRAYEINICALTNNPQRTRSVMSQTLAVITTPAMQINNNMTPAISIQVESINEEKLHVNWKTFVPMIEIRCYYIHYTCLNTGEIQTMKVSKRYRHATIRNLNSGFTYEIMVLAVDKNGRILYSSEKSTIHMNVSPNAPIVAIRERTNDHVTLEWRPAPNCDELTIVSYKIYVNNRLIAILSNDQLTYTLTNGSACEEYIVYIQAISDDKNIPSPMSRGVKFLWPGIKPGIFRRLDDGQTGIVVVAWEQPRLEDETDKLIGFKLFSENMSTHVVRSHGEYNAETYRAVIYNLSNAKYLLWLEIQSELYSVRARPITITSGRFRSRSSFAPAKCFLKKQKR